MPGTRSYNSCPMTKEFANDTLQLNWELVDQWSEYPAVTAFQCRGVFLWSLGHLNAECSQTWHVFAKVVMRGREHLKEIQFTRPVVFLNKLVCALEKYARLPQEGGDARQTLVAISNALLNVENVFGDAFFPNVQTMFEAIERLSMLILEAEENLDVLEGTLTTTLGIQERIACGRMKPKRLFESILDKCLFLLLSVRARCYGSQSLTKAISRFIAYCLFNKDTIDLLLTALVDDSSTVFARLLATELSAIKAPNELLAKSFPTLLRLFLRYCRHPVGEESSDRIPKRSATSLVEKQQAGELAFATLIWKQSRVLVSDDVIFMQIAAGIFGALRSNFSYHANYDRDHQQLDKLREMFASCIDLVVAIPEVSVWQHYTSIVKNALAIDYSIVDPKLDAMWSLILCRSKIGLDGSQAVSSAVLKCYSDLRLLESPLCAYCKVVNSEDSSLPSCCPLFGTYLDAVPLPQYAALWNMLIQSVEQQVNVARLDTFAYFLDHVKVDETNALKVNDLVITTWAIILEKLNAHQDDAALLALIHVASSLTSLAREVRTWIDEAFVLPAIDITILTKFISKRNSSSIVQYSMQLVRASHDTEGLECNLSELHDLVDNILSSRYHFTASISHIDTLSSIASSKILEKVSMRLVLLETNNEVERPRGYVSPFSSASFYEIEPIRIPMCKAIRALLLDERSSNLHRHVLALMTSMPHEYFTFQETTSSTILDALLLRYNSAVDRSAVLQLVCHVACQDIASSVALLQTCKHLQPAAIASILFEMLEMDSSILDFELLFSYALKVTSQVDSPELYAANLCEILSRSAESSIRDVNVTSCEAVNLIVSNEIILELLSFCSELIETVAKEGIHRTSQLYLRAAMVRLFSFIDSPRCLSNEHIIAISSSKTMELEHGLVNDVIQFVPGDIEAARVLLSISSCTPQFISHLHETYPDNLGAIVEIALCSQSLPGSHVSFIDIIPRLVASSMTASIARSLFDRLLQPLENTTSLQSYRLACLKTLMQVVIHLDPNQAVPVSYLRSRKCSHTIWRVLSAFALNVPSLIVNVLEAASTFLSHANLVRASKSDVAIVFQLCLSALRSMHSEDNQLFPIVCTVVRSALRHRSDSVYAVMGGVYVHVICQLLDRIADGEKSLNRIRDFSRVCEEMGRPQHRSCTGKYVPVILLQCIKRIALYKGLSLQTFKHAMFSLVNTCRREEYVVHDHVLLGIRNESCLYRLQFIFAQAEADDHHIMFKELVADMKRTYTYNGFA